MANTTTAATPSRPRRSNGQWAVDGRAPLNPNEEFKQAGGSPLAVRELSLIHISEPTRH